jgi:hypothetical protein
MERLEHFKELSLMRS